MRVLSEFERMFADVKEVSSKLNIINYFRMSWRFSSTGEGTKKRRLEQKEKADKNLPWNNQGS